MSKGRHSRAKYLPKGTIPLESSRLKVIFIVDNLVFLGDRVWQWHILDKGCANTVNSVPLSGVNSRRLEYMA